MRHSGTIACSLLLGALLGVQLGVTGRTQAQASGGDKAAAEILYDRGITLMRDGKTAEACKQFEQSQAIERGIGTMLHLAECYETLGRTASAWALFREAASTARFEGQTDRVKWGNDRAAALAPKLSMLTLQVSPDNQMAGFVLTRDGTSIAPGLWNVPVPVDPGVHKLHAEAPDHREWNAEVNVGADADSVTFSVPALVHKPQAAVAAPGSIAPLDASSPNAGSSVPAHSPPSDSGGWAGQRTFGLVVGGVGVVGLGVGAAFGLAAISKKSELDKCDTKGTCSVKVGVARNNAVHDAATLSTIFVIGGAALAVSGLVLVLTSNSEESPQTALGVDVGPGAARLTLGGAF